MVKAEKLEIESLYNLTLQELLEIQVVTAASGFEQAAQRAPASVTIITNEEWRAKGARLLSDVLSSVPGFHVGKPQGDFMHKKFTIRGLSGFSSSQIKLLIDGEPFEWMQSNSLPVGFQMPLTGFERIEVIKGPGSAIYGADAFGGIINLVTFKHNEMPSIAGLRTGSFNTYDLFIRDNFSIGGSHFQWSLDYSQSSDDKNRIVESDLQTTFDGLFNTSASMAPGPLDEHYEVLSLVAKWQWQDLSIDYFSWRNFDMGIGAGPAQVLVPNGKGRTYANQFKAQYDFSELVSGDLKATLSYKRQRTELYLTVFPAGTVLPIGADGNVDFVNPVGFPLFEDGLIGTPSPGGNSTTVRLTHLLNLPEQHLLRWEIGYEEQHFKAGESKNFGPGVLNGSETIVTGNLVNVTGTPYVYAPESYRDFYYISLQDEWQINSDLQITLGTRYDNYSDFGSTINPRLGMIWQASDNFTLKLFAGSAFRAPSLFQLYGRNNPVNIGNASLGPEKLDTIETGFNFEYVVDENLVFSANFFNYHAKDLIDFVFDEQQQANIAQNIGEQKGSGGEFWLKWKPQDNITLDFSYSFLSAKDETDVVIADTPENMAYVAANWKINDNWMWNINAKWIANRKRPADDIRSELPNYKWMNFRLERNHIIEGLKAALIINNVLDEDMREPSNGNIADDYPLPGRQIMLELTYSF